MAESITDQIIVEAQNKGEKFLGEAKEEQNHLVKQQIQECLLLQATGAM